MIEVEAKVKIENPDEIKKKIKKFFKLIGKQNKIDDYYTNLPLNEYPAKSFRIRKIGEKFSITSKKPLSYIKGVFAKKENEVEIKDLRSFIKKIESEGFKRWLRKEKLSDIYEAEKNLHIELNKVKHLGYFLEIECLTENSVKLARKKVLSIIKLLGIHKNQIIKKGYTKMLWNKGIRGF